MPRARSERIKSPAMFGPRHWHSSVAASNPGQRFTVVAFSIRDAQNMSLDDRHTLCGFRI